jgi:DNA-directed RNA polymerase subunit L
MELRVIEKEKNLLRLEIIGEDHTFCNALRKELWNDSDVTFAGYKIEHSLIDNPILVLQTKTKSPKAVLEKAVKRLKANNKKLRELFNKL